MMMNDALWHLALVGSLSSWWCIATGWGQDLWTRPMIPRQFCYDFATELVVLILLLRYKCLPLV